MNYFQKKLLSSSIHLLKAAFFSFKNSKLDYLASVAHAVTQAFGGMELEDGLRTVRRPKRLHGHCGVCISPTVMLNPHWGMAWLWGWGRGHNSHAKT